MSASDPLALLAELDEVGRLGDGAAHIVSVEAIRDAFGPRWPERRVLVWEMTELQLQRRLPTGDLAFRIGDAEFLIVATDARPALAQATAARAMRDVLTHFLGEARPHDISIRMVTALVDGEAVARQVSPQEIEAAEREAGHGAEPKAPVEPASFAPARPAARVGDADASHADALKGEPLTTFDGRRLRVSFRIDPVIDLVRMVPAGHRVEPLMFYDGSGTALTPTERMQLLPSDMERVDLAALERVSTRLGDTSARRSHILCVSFLTVTNMRARSRLFDKAQRMRAALHDSVVWELTDVEEGAPAGRLTEVFTLLKPFGRAIFLRTSSAFGLKAALAVGAPGLVAQPPALVTDAKDAAMWLLQAGKAMGKAAPTLVAADLPSVDVLPVAAEAGFTHAALRIRA